MMEAEQKKKEHEDMRAEILTKILSPAAHTRLGTITIAKPEKVPRR